MNGWKKHRSQLFGILERAWVGRQTNMAHLLNTCQHCKSNHHSAHCGQRALLRGSVISIQALSRMSFSRTIFLTTAGMVNTITAETNILKNQSEDVSFKNCISQLVRRGNTRMPSMSVCLSEWIECKNRGKSCNNHTISLSLYRLKMCFNFVKQLNVCNVYIRWHYIDQLFSYVIF